MNIIIFNTKFNQDENFSLNKSAVADYALSAFAKSKAEPENSNLLQGEQQHAYLNRAFFVRSLRTSNENTILKNQERRFLSMVVRNGKGSPFADFLVGQFLSPLRTTAQTLRSLAVVLSNHYKETVMLFNSHLADFPQNLTRCNRCDVATFSTFGGVSANAVHPTEQKTILQALAVFGYPFGVVAKSTTSREKLNDLSVANDSTPFHRAFFVRDLRTPKINLALGLFSMVGRIGQPLAVGCLPQMAVSHPDTSYRPAVRSQAVAPKFICGAITMIYKFLCLNRTKPTYNQETLYIEADSEDNARFQLTADYRLLLERAIGRFHQHPNPAPTSSTLNAKCQQERTDWVGGSVHGNLTTTEATVLEGIYA